MLCLQVRASYYSAVQSTVKLLNFLIIAQFVVCPHLTQWQRNSPACKMSRVRFSAELIFSFFFFSSLFCCFCCCCLFLSFRLIYIFFTYCSFVLFLYICLFHFIHFIPRCLQLFPCLLNYFLPFLRRAAPELAIYVFLVNKIDPQIDRLRLYSHNTKWNFERKRKTIQ